MTSPDFEDWTIASVRRAIVRGDVSAEQLTRHHLDRIADLNGTLNAMVTLDNGALLAAKRLDDEFGSRRTLVGPLHGIPGGGQGQLRDCRSGSICPCDCSLGG